MNATRVPATTGRAGLGLGLGLELKVIVMTEKYVEIPENKVALRGEGGAGEEGGGGEYRKQEKVEFRNKTCTNSAREKCAARLSLKCLIKFQ